MDEPLNLVLFSGTDDKLNAAAVLTAGAAALGKPVNVFLRTGPRRVHQAKIERPRPRPERAPRVGRNRCPTKPAGLWAETLRQAKDLGTVDIQACSLSMDLLGLEEADLDPLVDGVEGVTAFYLNAGEGQVVFI
jgi:peroxiredoxin family protein